MERKIDIPVNFPTAPFGKYGLLISETDPFGAYTGISKDINDIPVQDADDL